MGCGVAESDTLGDRDPRVPLSLIAILFAARVGRRRCASSTAKPSSRVCIPRSRPHSRATDRRRTADAFENTSGGGKSAVVPPQVKRWNWGAFFLTPIWAIANSVWIGLLGFVPVVNFMMSFVLGVKGNERHGARSAGQASRTSCSHNAHGPVRPQRSSPEPSCSASSTHSSATSRLPQRPGTGRRTRRSPTTPTARRREGRNATASLQRSHPRHGTGDRAASGRLRTSVDS